jgi:hypothetical protein
MARFVRPRRFTVSLIEAAKARALLFEAAIAQQISDLRISQSHTLRSELRAYLDKQDRTTGKKNDIFKLLKLTPSANGVALINLGTPSLDRTSDAFILRSGSRLTFGITLRDNAGMASLVSYRFQIQFPEHHSPSYLRFDLIHKQHEAPLREARCHLHPGAGDIRIPTPVLTPIEVLDRIFFAFEPSR